MGQTQDGRHRMELRGPWQYQLPGASTSSVPNLPARGSVKFPCLWQQAFGDWTGPVEFTRRFQRPTGLESGDRVLIAISKTADLRELMVNETTVPGVESETTQAGDVTDLVQPTNLLRLVCGENSGLIQVWIEIVTPDVRPSNS